MTETMIQPCDRCGFSHSPENYCGPYREGAPMRPQPHPENHARNAIIGVLVALAVIFITGKIGDNMTYRNDPPAACQILGGHWNIWDGWQCY